MLRRVLRLFSYKTIFKIMKHLNKCLQKLKFCGQVPFRLGTCFEGLCIKNTIENIVEKFVETSLTSKHVPNLFKYMFTHFLASIGHF